jgi:hypothetical protein
MRNHSAHFKSIRKSIKSGKSKPLSSNFKQNNYRTSSKLGFLSNPLDIKLNKQFKSNSARSGKKSRKIRPNARKEDLKKISSSIGNDLLALKKKQFSRKAYKDIKEFRNRKIVSSISIDQQIKKKFSSRKKPQAPTL